MLKPFGEAQKALQEALATRYPDQVTAAFAYLRAIEGTTIADQKTLFGTVLQRHYITAPKNELQLRKVIDAEHLAQVGEAIHEQVIQWIEAALSANRSIGVTASTLWDNVSRYEGNDKIIAVSILIHPNHKLVPYAFLAAAPALSPLCEYSNAYDGALDKVAEILRFLQAPGISTVERTVRLNNLLDRCTETERIALLRIVTEWAIRGGTQQTVLVGVTFVPPETAPEPE